ncbi:Rhamnogalacturonides degradation protein RhiN [Furfurilactobacillus rossiae]|uniref:glycoside hydrolase family 88/105 protein n=1 Tax=Furfurilactobacillus rossiae TaxID=231049 RepID=UPI0015BEE281|nr:glycoside hydrolase family 88 protein [Furfurilactobacillus rossiae]MCF6165745.1 glycoside hydrolase family 88 protein [Furfurilactobacillus rossiae]QLE63132.1 Rhamnogalacturonides degradation protein RhiN [Furfurilactobacillus rossiae]
MIRIRDERVIRATIESLLDNLVHLSDPTGEFSIKVADGSIIDNKSFHYWEWTSGIGLYGMMKYYKITNDEDVLNQIVEWFDEELPQSIEKNINTMVQMLTLADLYDITHDKQYLPILNEWGTWLYEEAHRTKFGGLQHVTFGDLNPQEMWDDTLMMSVLPMARLGLLFKRPEYIEEAKHQFLLHIKYLQDKHTGLWYHGWTFNENNNFGGVFWGRGNSWITIAIPEFLNMIKLASNDGTREFLTNCLNDQVEALSQCQDQSGLWHTVLDDPTSYLEGSATAGFTYGILTGVANGYLDSRYQSVGMKGIDALFDNISSDGALAHVSAGTPMGDNAEFYKQIKISTMPYGQSMAVLALTAYLQDVKKGQTGGMKL